MRTAMRTSVAAVLVAAGTFAVQTPASADSVWFADRRGDILASNDIEQVRVDNGSREGTEVKVVVQLRNLRFDHVDVYVNTDANDPGPEYRAGGTADSDDLTLHAVERWSSEGTLVDCPGLRVAMDTDDPSERARFRLPRTCLDEPGAVRVAAHSSRLTSNGSQNDWAPSYRHYYPWVSLSS
ncbi:MAG: hypothetical protein ACRDYU_03555 [Actinomycetes bacterium]